MQSVWQILAIAPTRDVKTIKKAYATLIKQYRPDVHPEEFQNIHNAYQTALDWARDPYEDVDEDASPADTEESYLPADWPESAADNKLPPVGNLADNPSQPLTEEIACALLAQQQARLGALQHLSCSEFNRLSNWHFLADDLAIYDVQYNLQLGVAVVRALHTYTQVAPAKNSKKGKKAKQQPSEPAAKVIEQGLWDYLESLFNWRSNARQLVPLLLGKEKIMLVKAHILDTYYLPSWYYDHTSANTPIKKSSIWAFKWYKVIILVLLFLGFLEIRQGQSKQQVQRPIEAWRQWVNLDFASGLLTINKVIDCDEATFEATIGKAYVVEKIAVLSSSCDPAIDKQIAAQIKAWPVNVSYQTNNTLPARNVFTLQFRKKSHK